MKTKYNETVGEWVSNLTQKKIRRKIRSKGKSVTSPDFHHLSLREIFKNKNLSFALKLLLWYFYNFNIFEKILLPSISERVLLGVSSNLWLVHGKFLTNFFSTNLPCPKIQLLKYNIFDRKRIFSASSFVFFGKLFRVIYHWPKKLAYWNNRI